MTADPIDPARLHREGVRRLQNGEAAAGAGLIEAAMAQAPTAAGLSDLAYALNALGRPAEAARSAERAIALSPGDAKAWLNLGVARRGLGSQAEAEAAFQRAVELAPASSHALCNLGLLRLEAGDAANAQSLLERADALTPGVAAIQAALGQCLLMRQQPEAALVRLEAAVRLDPKLLHAQANLGAALMALDRPEAAVEAYRCARALDPQRPEAEKNLAAALAAAAVRRLRGTAAAEAASLYAEALSLGSDNAAWRTNLGVALRATGRLQEALEQQERAVALAPELGSAWTNLGVVLADLRRLEAAIAAYRRALECDPELVSARSNIAAALIGLGRHEEAIAEAEAAVARAPEHMDARLNLAAALFRSGLGERAEAAIAWVLERDPDQVEGHWNRGLLLLQQGRWSEGWPEYEWGLKSPTLRPARGIAAPLWRGEPLEGRSILVHAEQGLGDTLQCARYLPLVAARGGVVTVLAQESLRELLSAMPGVSGFTPEGAPAPETDLQVPIFSLPHRFETTPETIPPAPYLIVPPERAAFWAGRIPREGFRIGVVWQGNSTAKVDVGRSFPLASLAPIAALPGVRLISLQKSFGLDQLAALPSGLTVETLGADYDAGTFADTAAVLANLDLLIACDTSALHLAGAIGRPAWAALARPSDWRWLLGRSDTPWYPSVRLYRQASPGDWTPVFEAMRRDLQPGLRRRG